MIKIIASDMDGTLLNDKRELPKGIFETLEELYKRGVHFVVSSGRSYNTLKKQFESFKDKMDFICDNGSYVVENGVITFLSIINSSLVKEIIKLCREKSDVKILLCGRKGTYYSDFDAKQEKEISCFYINHRRVPDIIDINDDIFKFAIYDEKGAADNIEPILNESFKGLIHTQTSGRLWVDIMNNGVNKGRAFTEIMKHKGILRSEAMAFGDFNNDIQLLKSCDYSFAMENACPAAKEAANFIAPSNNDNGVMRTIREYILEREKATSKN